MTKTSLRALFAVCVLSALTGCGAMHESMHELEHHYIAARNHAGVAAYAKADAEALEVEAIVNSDAVARANDDPRFVELHAELVTKLGGLRKALAAEDAEQTQAAFEATSDSCRACHAEYR